jgi:hypothetical protein
MGQRQITTWGEWVAFARAEGVGFLDREDRPRPIESFDGFEWISSGAAVRVEVEVPGWRVISGDGSASRWIQLPRVTRG